MKATKTEARYLDRQRTETWRLDRDSRLVITIAERQGDRESRDTLTYRRR